MAPFIVTLAGLLFARGLAFKVSDNGNTTHLIERDRWMINLGHERLLGIGLPVWIALAVFGLAVVVLNRTRLGQATYAIGGSEDAASLMGLRVARVKITLYALIGMLSGVAGMLVAARSSSGLSTIGDGMELEAIAAVVIGGTLLSGGRGTIVGTVFGVLIFTTLNNVFTLNNLSISAQSVAKGLIIVIAVLLQQRLAARASAP
jgi:ribose transport system permease protein